MYSVAACVLYSHHNIATSIVTTYNEYYKIHVLITVLCLVILRLMGPYLNWMMIILRRSLQQWGKPLTVQYTKVMILCVYWSLGYCNCVLTESARKKLSVDLLKFVLFLYIQNAPRVSLKSSIVNDQYPLQYHYMYDSM